MMNKTKNVDPLTLRQLLPNGGSICWHGVPSTKGKARHWAKEIGMLARHNKPFDVNPSGCVNVLTDPCNDTLLGYGLGGFKAGPHLMVIAEASNAAVIYDRLLQLPTLARMHGSLTLIIDYTDAGIDPLLANSDLLSSLPDQILSLAALGDRDQPVKKGYLAILEKCTALGMISGRGVPSYNPN